MVADSERAPANNTAGSADTSTTIWAIIEGKGWTVAAVPASSQPGTQPAWQAATLLAPEGERELRSIPGTCSASTAGRSKSILYKESLVLSETGTVRYWYD